MARVAVGRALGRNRAPEIATSVEPSDTSAIICANPKSSSFGAPWWVKPRLLGLTSRCR